MRHVLRALTISLALGAAAVAQPVRTIYVDDSAPAGGDGATWDTAYASLQTAMNASVAAGSKILVGQGLYTPAGPGGARTTSFVIRSQFVSIRGGYAGYGAADPDARNPALYPTILSGDLNGDDGPDFANNEENVYHVARATNVSGSTSFEGFVITAGNADLLGGMDFAGAGLRTDSSAIVVRDCVFEANSSYRAGAHYAMVTMASGAPQFFRCAFRHNRATGSYAGAIYTESFSGRPPQNVVNCEFTGNTAGQYAAPFLFNGVDLLLLNCLIADNVSLDGVAAGGNSINGAVKVINCTIANNTAPQIGPGFTGGLLIFAVGSPTITGCIFRGNTGVQLLSDPPASVTYNDIEGGFVGPGNIDADALFIGPGDYRLGAGSPCVDAANTTANLTNAGPLGIAADLAGVGRYQEDPSAPDTGVGGPPVVDMGCYERLPGAVIPPDPCPVDTNGDGVIDFSDLNSILSYYGLPCP